MGRARRVPAALLVPRAGGGQEDGSRGAGGGRGAGLVAANGGAPVPAGAPILLASEGRAIPAAAIDRAAQLAKECGSGRVHVFTVARVWGTSLGLPNPGLLPSKKEWDEQRGVVADAVEQLKRRGVQASGQVLATRKATKRILAEAARHDCGAIVMAADRPRNRFLADLMWSQEPYRVQRRAHMPVILVTDR